MNRFCCALPFVLLLAACAATPYQPSGTDGYGYSDAQDAADAYTVVFVANSATPEQQVRDFALLHAAELGASRGYAYMKVSEDKSGIIMLNGRGGSSPGATTPAAIPSAGGSGSRMGMGMSGGYGGGYGGNGNGGGYSVNAAASGGTPARAAFVKVRFFTQAPAAAGDAAQPITSLVARIRAEYALPVLAPTP